MRAVYSGLLGGVLNILVLLFPLYFVMPARYTVDWVRVPSSIGNAGYFLAVIITLIAGYSAAGWSWASTKSTSVKAGLLAGMVVGIVSWLGIGAGAAGVIGHRAIFQYGPRAAGNEGLPILISEAVVQVSYLTHFAFWVLIIFGTLLGGLGGWFHGIFGAEALGSRPPQIAGPAQHTLPIILLLLAASQAVITAMIFQGIAIATRRAADLVHHTLSFSENGIFLLPVTEMLITMTFAAWWNWHRIRMLRGSSSPALHSTWRINSIITAIMPILTAMAVCIIIEIPENYTVLILTILGVIIVTLRGVHQTFWERQVISEAIHPPMVVRQDWKDFVITIWLVVATLFMLGNLAAALSLTVGVIDWIGVLTGGPTVTTSPSIAKDTINNIFTIQTTVSLSLLTLPFAFLLVYQSSISLQQRATQDQQIRLDENRLKGYQRQRDCISTPACLN
jgi:hypothetical protein